jgi:hypothetical protein
MLIFPAIFLWLVAVIVIIMGLSDQRSLYWKWQAWRYRDPEAHEPSERAYDRQRGRSLFGAGMCVIAGFVMLSLNGSLIKDQSEVRSAAESVASDIDGTSPQLISPFSVSEEIYDAMRDIRGVKMEQIWGAWSGDEQRYEFTNDQGDNPVCLIVDSDSQADLLSEELWRTTITTSVQDGKC